MHPKPSRPRGFQLRQAPSVPQTTRQPQPRWPRPRPSAPLPPGQGEPRPGVGARGTAAGRPPAGGGPGPRRGCSPWARAALQSAGGSGRRQCFLRCTLSVRLFVCPGSCTLAAKTQGAANGRGWGRAAEPGSRIRASVVSPTVSEREGSPSVPLDSPTCGEAAAQARGGVKPSLTGLQSTLGSISAPCKA